MVGEKVNVRDKKKGMKRFFKWFGLIILIAVIGFAVYYTVFSLFISKDDGERVVLENPLKGLIIANTNENNEVDIEKVVEQGVLEFDESYINYILFALRIDNLHKSPLNFENPLIEIDVGEIWSSELIKGNPSTVKRSIDNEDMKIVMSKEEAVMALLSNDVTEFMKDSVRNGNTQVGLVSNKLELFNKGYLGMYKEITGEELELEE